MNDVELKAMELTSEFSIEKCNDICDTLIDVAERLNNLEEVYFWICVKDEIKLMGF